MKFKYAVFYEGGKPIGKAYFQVLHFDGEKSLSPKKEEAFCSVLSVVKRGLKQLVAYRIQLRTLVSGNLLTSGIPTYFFVINTPELELQYLDQCICTIISDAIAQKEDIPMIILKDIKSNHTDYVKSTSKGVAPQFYPFTIQPVMMMDILDRWYNFDDYVDSLSSKYRVRTRRALKLKKKIRKEELDMSQMVKYKDRMATLFRDVVDNAKFNMVDINIEYFFALKKSMPKEFRIYGYFIGDEIVGFYTTIMDGSQLVAHFLGYDVGLNKAYKLYSNMLYDILRDGILAKAKSIDYARTATEIKSSIGAYSVDYPCFIRHRKNFTNQFIPKLVDYFNPTEEWTPRNPFKTQSNASQSIADERSIPK